MRNMQIVVEPSQNTFTGFNVYIRFETFEGSQRYRGVSFTNWPAAIAWFASSNCSLDNFAIVVRSELDTQRCSVCGGFYGDYGECVTFGCEGDK